MSDDYFKSSSESYSSTYDYKPSGYTDFTSQSTSFNQENDSSKKQDNYSSFSSDNTNNQDHSRSYNVDDTNNSQDAHYSSYSDSSCEKKPQPNTSFESVPMYEYISPEHQPLTHIPNTNIPIPNSVTMTPHKLQNYTVRDVLELPLDRQEYLKTLPIQTLKLHPEYQVLMKRPQVVLGIVDYYEKIIHNPVFNSQVKNIKQGKQFKEVFFMASFLGYIYFWMQKSKILNANLKKIFQHKYHAGIPFGILVLMSYSSNSSRKQTQTLINDQRNSQYIDIAVRKFICDANKKEKMVIFGQS